MSSSRTSKFLQKFRSFLFARERERFSSFYRTFRRRGARHGLECPVLCGSPEYIFGKPTSTDKLVRFLNENGINEFVVVKDTPFKTEILYKLSKETK